MNRYVMICIVILVVSLCALGDPVCPADAIASDSELVSGALGSVAVEVCVTRAGGQDTYTYRLTDLGSRTQPPCGLLLSGLGSLDTVSMTSPTGWISSTHPSTDCGSWWTWSDSPRGLDIGSMLLLRTLTMSVTVDAETVPADVSAAISFCGKSAVPFTILGPAQATAATDFVGEGPRIRILGGADTQTIAECSPSWVRHGFSDEGLNPDDGEFRLFVDTVEIPLDRQVVCAPWAEVGVEVSREWYYKQFPSEYFSVGLHEVTGVWEWSAAVAPPDGYSWERTINLLVEGCRPEPIPLPDLRVRIGSAECICDWTPQKQYECTTSVQIIVSNHGDVDCPSSGLLLQSGKARSVLAIPELAPGEDYEKELKVVSDDYRFGQEPCPLMISATIDFGDQIPELDENNNTIEYEICCE